tara:strand:+ start:2219 stop:2518 length:300 start_codon:yes stop_codon:yes gene_type:complete
MSINAAVKSVARQAVDAILSPRCLGCGEVVSVDGAVCPDCRNGIGFIFQPFCTCCGLPFAFDVSLDSLCGACSSEVPTFGRAQSAVVCNDLSENLIRDF